MRENEGFLGIVSEADGFMEPGLPDVDHVALPHEQVMPGKEMGVEAHGRHGRRGGRPAPVIVVPVDQMRQPAFEPGSVDAPLSRSKVDAQHQFLRDLRRDTATGIGSGLISPQAQLVLGQERERRATSVPEGDRLIVPDDWLNALPEYMQRLEEARRNFLEAANYKRRGETGWSTEKLSGNTGLERLTDEETANLYAHYPGLRQAMELYVQLTRQPQNFTFQDPLRPGRLFTLSNHEGATEANAIRNYIAGRLIEGLERARVVELTRAGLSGAETRALYGEGLITEYARMQARAAEQLALNILYAGSFWEGEGWLSPGQGLFVNVPIRSAHRPMDSFVSLALSAAKNPDGRTDAGLLGTWINNFLVEGFRRAYGRNLKDLQMTDIVYEPVSETGGNWRKFWTVERRRDGKCVVRVPEGLPIELLKPAFQGVVARQERVGGRKVDVTLADLLERGERIDWERIAKAASGFWGTYNYYLKQNGDLYDFLRGKKDPAKDAAGLPGTLGVLKKSEDWKLKRWIVYVFLQPMDATKRKPSLRRSGYSRKLFAESYARHDGRGFRLFQKPRQVLFPWDMYGPLTGI